MYDFEYLPNFVDECSSDVTEHSEDDRNIDDRIKRAESVEEIASIISDELVRSIKEQLHL